jgi:hypothetical protein
MIEVEYRIWCDRCLHHEPVRGVNNQGEAQVAARKKGWAINLDKQTATCLACKETRRK